MTKLLFYRRLLKHKLASDWSFIHVISPTWFSSSPRKDSFFKFCLLEIIVRPYIFLIIKSEVYNLLASKLEPEVSDNFP